MNTQSYIVIGAKFSQLEEKKHLLEQELTKNVKHPIYIKLYMEMSGACVELQSLNDNMSFAQFWCGKLEKALLLHSVNFESISNQSIEQREKTGKKVVWPVLKNLILSSIVIALFISLARLGYQYCFGTFPDAWLTSFMATFSISSIVVFVLYFIGPFDQ